uniref:CUB_2 domain-containing protein n=1 Tax=Caenorhabditis tropicalis TaxID=1561998 RepID=A0A1I7U1I1_9PELO
MRIVSYAFLLILSNLFRFSLQFTCTQISDRDETSGSVLNIPNNSSTPVPIPSNFNCTYTIKPPKLVFAQITVTNVLSGANDVIIVSDGQQKTSEIRKNSPNKMIFYVFPQTTTTVNVQNFDDSSKFQMTIDFISLPKPEQRTLQKGQNLNYVTLSSIQKKPLSLSSDGPITLTLALSSYLSDVFDNYFLIDGDMDNPKSIKRLVDFQLSNFNTSSNIVSIVGLDEAVSHSTLILNPSSQLNGFSKFRGFTVDETNRKIEVKAENGEKIGVMIVSNNIQQLVLNRIELGEENNCKSVAITGPPTSDSMTLIDFKSDDYSLPQLFPYPYFSIIVENCDAQFNITNSISSDYYNIESDRSGFIFSPIYFNSEATNGYMNITFTYNGEERRRFSVDVDRVTFGSINSELDINIYDSDWKKTLSTVITGNQEGTRSRALGSYLNVQMYGSTAARLHWSLSSYSSSFFNLPFIIMLSALMIMISN